VRLTAPGYSIVIYQFKINQNCKNVPAARLPQPGLELFQHHDFLPLRKSPPTGQHKMNNLAEKAQTR